MEYDERPQLDSPNVIAAFQGWNDAGQAATTAVRYLVDTYKARAFARIDPEEYFSFTDTRPIIRIADGDTRELSFAKNEFYWRGAEGDSPAAVILIGTEPNLKWRTFCGEILDLARGVGARRIVTLGSLVTEAVHTRPVPLTGWATDASVQAKFAARGITRSSYEGPTGIVGTLHSFCLNEGMPTASLWAASPYYLGTTPNPKTALGLLDALDDSLALKLNLAELRGVADEFVRQVSLAVKDNDDVQERIRLLEQQHDAQRAAEPATPPEFPPTRAIIADLEDFLREQRED